jgi:hypothetical protein
MPRKHPKNRASSRCSKNDSAPLAAGLHAGRGDITNEVQN